MIRNAIFILTLFFAQALLAAETVRLRTDIDLVVTGIVDANVLSLNVEEPSGDATADSAPAKLYLPIQNDPDQTHKFFITTTTSLFDTSDDAHYALIPLRVNTPADSTQRYLYAAVKDTTNSNAYKVIKKYTATTLSIGAESDVSFSFAPADICLSIPTECTSLLIGSSSKVEKIFTVYFFLSTQSAYGPSDTIDPATLNSGIYFSMLMSNRIYESTDLIIAINKVRVGDNRLILEYTASGTVNASYAKSTRVFKHNSAPAATNSPIADFSGAGALTSKEYPYAQNGELIVSDLVNNDPAFLSVAFVDKFNFVTNLSIFATGTPLDIEELLKKQGCFLLTAGFGEEHYVIQFFRHFRDATLSKSYLGQLFINFYYETAPKYALEIYHSPALRFMIRSMAYVAYAVFNYYWLLFAFLSFIILRILLSRKLHKN